MDWIPLTSSDQIAHFFKPFDDNFTAPLLLFKHSPRCGTSIRIKKMFEEEFNRLQPEIPVHLLDVIAYRELAASLAKRAGVQHESPQLLLFKGKKCLYHASHCEISADEINDVLAQL
ncbi:MAG: bacillithiol system redox-active protein YtxJ [Flavobacteriales bacterium]